MSEVTTPPSSPNTILLRGKLADRPNEGRVAATKTVYPGMLVEKVAAGAQPYGDWQPHATAGSYAEKVVALELGMVADIPYQTFTGGTIDDAYAAGDLMFLHHCDPGDELYMYLPASATAVVQTDFLTSNGDGTLKKATSTDIRSFKALESVNNSGGSSRARIRVRAL